jgi:hypothetical protein
MSDDPRRWTEDPDAPGGVGEALRAARAELPTDAQLAAVAAGLGPLLGGGGGGGGGGPTAGAGKALAGGGAAATGMASGTKVVIFLIVGTLVVATLGTWAVVEDRRARPRQWPVDAAEIAGDGGASPGVDDGVDGSTGAELTPSPSPSPSPSPGPGSTRPAVAHQEPEARDPGRQQPSPPPELQLLQQAQDALARSPARALDLAEDHARHYPNGALAQEREVLAVDALLRLGRRGQAEARAERFRAAHPGSSQVRRLERLLSGE